MVRRRVESILEHEGEVFEWDGRQWSDSSHQLVPSALGQKLNSILKEKEGARPVPVQKLAPHPDPKPTQKTQGPLPEKKKMKGTNTHRSVWTQDSGLPSLGKKR